MRSFLFHEILLAQATRWEGMSRNFQARRTHIDSHDVALGAVILLCCLLAVWVLSFVARLQERQRPLLSKSPLGLFLGLCRAHGLRWSERWLLWRVAMTRRLRDPARLFLEPGLFDPGTLTPSLRAQAVELRQLRERLFAQPEQQAEERATGPSSGAELGEAPRSERASKGSVLPPISATPALDIAPWPPSTGIDFDWSVGQETEQA